MKLERLFTFFFAVRECLGGQSSSSLVQSLLSFFFLLHFFKKKLHFFSHDVLVCCSKSVRLTSVDIFSAQEISLFGFVCCLLGCRARSREKRGLLNAQMRM